MPPEGQPDSDIREFDQSVLASGARSKQLDMLRAVAVVLVMGRHMKPCPDQVSAPLHWLTQAWHNGGWCGVDLFFVLSGFLISGLLFKEHLKSGAISFKRFFIRRGFKIYPSFWVLIAASVAVTFMSGRHLNSKNLIGELLFIQNYNGHMWDHTWSLAVEEHFYLMLPLILIALAAVCARSKNREANTAFSSIPLIFAVVAVTCLGLRIATSALVAYKLETHHFPTHLRIDSLFFGVLISYYYHYRHQGFVYWQTKYRLPLLLSGLAIFATPFFCESPQLFHTFGLTALYAAAGMILVGILAFPIKTNPVSNTLSYLGARSYSIYLWHMPIAVWGVAIGTALFGATHWGVYAVSYILTCMLVGTFFANVVELPFIRLRGKLVPDRQAGASAER